MRKPQFLVILGQKGQFWKFLAKEGKTVKIIKKLSVKFQKKIMNGFREKALRTDERTNTTPKVSTTSWSRDQKWCIFCNIWAIIHDFGVQNDRINRDKIF